jgi:restriction endonuclease
LDDELLANLNAVQLRNGLPPTAALASGDFTVEMETGTGKTYVYLRTVLELNRRFGFTKFVVVVPSVAIKEGVYKSLQIMEEHFRALYANVPFEFLLYDVTSTYFEGQAEGNEKAAHGHSRDHRGDCKQEGQWGRIQTCDKGHPYHGPAAACLGFGCAGGVS